MLQDDVHAHHEATFALDEPPLDGFLSLGDLITEEDLLNEFFVVYDADVEASLAAVPASDPAHSVLQAAMEYSEGSIVDLEKLPDQLAGLDINLNTASATSWGLGHYNKVREHRAPQLPEAPWELVIQKNGCTLASAAFSIAIQLVYYESAKPPSSEAEFKELRISGPTLLLIALAWNRQVQTTFKRFNLTASEPVAMWGLLASLGPFIMFRNSLDAEMKKSAQARLRIAPTKHRCPTDDEHAKVINSPAMDINKGAKETQARLSYDMGWQMGFRAGQEKYDTRRADMEFSMVKVGNFLRAKLLCNPGVNKTHTGGLKHNNIVRAAAVTFCPGTGEGSCQSLQGPYCGNIMCMIMVYGKHISWIPISGTKPVPECIFLTNPRGKNCETYLPLRMGINTISGLVAGAFKELGIKDLTAHCARVRYCTQGYKLKVP